jgi:starch synthase (maltosyl-transferring)
LDGHDLLSTNLLYKFSKDKTWTTVPMSFAGNDHYEALFTVSENGFYTYTIEAWVDHSASWEHEMEAKIKDGQHVNVELLMGANILETMAKIATKEDKPELKSYAKLFRDPKHYDEAVTFAGSPQMHAWIHQYPDKQNVSLHKELKIWADREKAGFSAWYSMFPRSAASKPNTHGTFKDVEENVLPRMKSLGFDVLYIPPIHPIGREKITQRLVKKVNLAYLMALVLSWADILPFIQN